MALATRCPHCQTVFRIVPDQLKLHRGLVRCGHCREVFDGVLHQVEPPARPAPAPTPSPAPAPETVAPASTQASEIVEQEALAHEEPVFPEAHRHDAADTASEAPATHAHEGATHEAAEAVHESGTHEAEAAEGTHQTAAGDVPDDRDVFPEAHHTPVSEAATDALNEPHEEVQEEAHEHEHLEVPSEEQDVFPEARHTAASDVEAGAEAEVKAEADVASEVERSRDVPHEAHPEETLTEPPGGFPEAHEVANAEAASEAPLAPSDEASPEVRPSIPLPPEVELPAETSARRAPPTPPDWDEEFPGDLPPGAPSGPFAPRLDFGHEPPEFEHVSKPLDTLPPEPIFDEPASYAPAEHEGVPPDERDFGTEVGAEHIESVEPAEPVEAAESVESAESAERPVEHIEHTPPAVDSEGAERAPDLHAEVGDATEREFVAHAAEAAEHDARIAGDAPAPVAEDPDGGTGPLEEPVAEAHASPPEEPVVESRTESHEKPFAGAHAESHDKPFAQAYAESLEKPVTEAHVEAHDARREPTSDYEEDDGTVEQFSHTRFGHEDDVIDVEPTISSGAPHYGPTAQSDPWAPTADSRVEPALLYSAPALAAAATAGPAFAPLDDDRNDFRIRVEPHPEELGEHQHPARRVLGWIVAVLLLVLLLAQLAWWQREPVMVRWPQTVNLYRESCAKLGCVVLPPHNIDQLQIETSALTQTTLPNQFELSMSVHNRAALALAWPDVEISLLDANQHVVIRRVVGPAQYLPAGTDLNAGLGADGHQPVRLLLTATGAAPANYSVLIFYP